MQLSRTRGDGAAVVIAAVQQLSSKTGHTCSCSWRRSGRVSFVYVFILTPIRVLTVWLVVVIETFIPRSFLRRAPSTPETSFPAVELSNSGIKSSYERYQAQKRHAAIEFTQKMERPDSISIVGAGPAGFALAADLQRRGRDVLIYSHPDRLRHVNKIKDSPDGYRHLRVSGPKTEPYSAKLGVTCDMAEAVSFASVIILTVPSTGQESIIQELKRFDLRGHIIIAVPGNLFALIASAEMQVGCILETNLSPYSCRMSDDGELLILGKKKVVYIAPFTRRKDTPQQVYDTVTDIFSMVRLNWCTSIIEVCLANVNGVFHPLMMLMNAGRIESTGGDFLLYRDGLTRSVSNAMVAIDKVRMAIAEAFGIGRHGQRRVESAIEISNACYSQGFTCLVDLGRNSPPHNKLKAPDTMDNRNLSEDVPDLLVCWCSLAEKLGIDASPLRAVIVFAQMATGVEYFKSGRNMAKLNLEHVSPDEIIRRFSPDVEQQDERMELIGSRL